MSILEVHKIEKSVQEEKRESSDQGGIKLMQKVSKNSSPCATETTSHPKEKEMVDTTSEHPPKKKQRTEKGKDIDDSKEEKQPPAKSKSIFEQGEGPHGNLLQQIFGKWWW